MYVILSRYDFHAIMTEVATARTETPVLGCGLLLLSLPVAVVVGVPKNVG